MVGAGRPLSGLASGCFGPKTAGQSRRVLRAADRERRVHSADAVDCTVITRLRIWNRNISARPGGRLLVRTLDPFDAGDKGTMNSRPV